MTPLGDLPGGPYDSTALGASSDGSVIVGASRTGPGNEGFRWTDESGMVGLGFLPGASTSAASAVSPDGSVIVGGSGDQAVRWTQDGGTVGLGDLGGDPFLHSFAWDVTADGSVVVGNSDGEVFVWDEVHGMRSLRRMLGFDMAGWGWLDARAISITAPPSSGLAGIRRNEAWIAVLPEPSALAFMALGALLAGKRRRGAL